MITTVVQVDISTNQNVKKKFIGSVFRGWLGYNLKCDTNKKCEGCKDTEKCPYFMVFKEKTGVRPYSILAFADKQKIRGIIRLYGDKKKFAPKILSYIKKNENNTHFGGQKYKIDSIKAYNQNIKPINTKDRVRIATVSPLHLTSNQDMEIIPSFNTILRSSIRAYNRIAKYHDTDNYPFHVGEEIIESDAEIVDFDINTVEYSHVNINNKKMFFSGVEGWVEYDTSALPSEIGTILGMGEALQIGKHTTYGFGGFMVTNKEDTD
ncbi:MAG: hypothetical protein AWU58_620 [Methanohalophilus sp. T328-1]|uniref:CRISPR system precrRNA processing endoribonuclease RAMP protein Cas6 n=1 Tax=Methanohalophilus sp. WG1-DM TaxID=2491675 RepID=UPI0007951BD8|nr:CRISPR system precrRNA processing endoribonuclease RAMP protein Cas6 [Methanohalophilus sp. WG1-DM]KXS46347.1 MAG: hypothetical protein AWU58_620 [Methanohalophilus sp. T328-1]RXG33746.1 hypothetical protein CI957_1575 [Methanohalophilus sp. WG1-DM]